MYTVTPLLQDAASYDFEDIKSDKAYAEAEANGCYVKIPAKDELFIDIDDEKSQNQFHLNIGKVDEQIGIVDPQWTASPSGEPGRFHVVVKLLRDVEPMERILLQALCGSDLKREALSWVRLVNNDPNPTLFYEKKPLQLSEGEKP
jgi:hypothetical protein